jgi:hypothetical protein
MQDTTSGVIPSNVEIGRLVGVHTRQVQRWVEEGGLTELQADRAACAIRLHPSLIWPDWWAGAERQGFTGSSRSAPRLVVL